MRILTRKWTIVKLGCLLGIFFSLTACQWMRKDRESNVDAQLSKTEPPSAAIPMANGEPQKGFEQQPSGEPTR